MGITVQGEPVVSHGARSSTRLFTASLLLLIGGSLLVLGILLSVVIGVADIKIQTVLESVLSFNQSKEHLIVRTLRLPRAMLAVFVGANLAVAGALMQAITRNPLASPQVFGINAGASFTVVASIVLFPGLSSSSLVYFAFVGAAMGGMIVYSAGGLGGMTPVKLALAGMAVHLLLSSLTEGIMILHENSTQNVIFWLTGAIDGSDWEDIHTLFPWSIVGMIGAICLAGPITILGLGEDVAKGLGQKIALIRLLAGLVVIVLAGASVAVAGPIGFIGLIIPHIMRHWLGVDYRYVIPFSALFGAILLVYADVLSRFIAYPFESPVGIVTSLIGAPFFLYLVYQGRKLK